MSVKRSPPNTPTGSIGPLLDAPTPNDPNPQQFRKRKQPDNDCSHASQLAEFRKEIVSILTDFTKRQDDKMTKISKDISDIKDDIKNIQHKTDNLLSEQNKIKTEIAEIKKNESNTIKKIHSLETDIRNVKASSKCAESANIYTVNDVMVEMQEREIRRKHLIIIGIPEIKTTDKKERIKYDLEESIKISKLVESTCQGPVRTMRLGKYEAEKTRPLKAIFNSAEEVKAILSNKENIEDDNIKIYSDRTPQQQKHLKDLKEELKTRTQNGETGLKIKYVRGVPKLISTPPKN